MPRKPESALKPETGAALSALDSMWASVDAACERAGLTMLTERPPGGFTLNEYAERRGMDHQNDRTGPPHEDDEGGGAQAPHCSAPRQSRPPDADCCVRGGSAVIPVDEDYPEDVLGNVITPAARHHQKVKPLTAIGEPEVKRQAVDYRHDAINPEFLQFLARIAGYAGKKYGDPLQYLESRLSGDRGPVNHARNHIGEYQRGVPHDHFGGDPRWHLAAAAYNLMMEFTYLSEGHSPDVWPPKP